MSMWSRYGMVWFECLLCLEVLSAVGHWMARRSIVDYSEGCNEKP